MVEYSEFSDEIFYVIRVKGLLDQKWSAWFDQFVILPLENDDSLLYGSVVDQAALHGILAKIRDLCLPLLLVELVTEEEISKLERDHPLRNGSSLQSRATARN